METTFQNAVKAFIAHFGGQTKAANAIGVRQPTVNGWLKSAHGMKAGNALKVEAATGGAVRAVDLCPDLAIGNDTAA